MIGIDLNQRVALVTGASSGIGLAIARTLQSAGATVVGADLLQGECPGRWIEVDVRQFDDARRCVQNVVQREGRLDILVNNAGIFRDAPSWKMTENDWDDVLAVNLKGAFNFTHHAAPHFRERQSGKIVNIASINGLRGKFGQANYAAAKAGLIGLTKTIARELARYNVNVNAVAPGLIATPLIRNLPADALDKAREEILLGRIGEPEDVARLVAFLCSDLARHITGEIIKVDGGQYI
jgi:3-oxoacyl-[acyl-carrier protein] reductase